MEDQRRRRGDDVNKLYGEDNKRFFSIVLHHDGYFTSPPGREYREGKMTTTDFLDIDGFTIEYIDNLMEEVRKTCLNTLTSSKTGETLDYGLRRLLLRKDAKKFKEGLNVVRHVYVENVFSHNKVKVYYPETYLTAPKTKIVDMLMEFVREKLGLPSYSARNIFEGRYGIQLPYSLLDSALDLATQRSIGEVD